MARAADACDARAAVNAACIDGPRLPCWLPISQTL
jgi:hypothetical protein